MIAKLLEGLIDYAGLFPPAALDMQPAVDEYARQLASVEHRALARFVVPVARLDELATAASDLLPPADRGTPWRLSALPGEARQPARASIDAFNAAHTGRAVIDCVELVARSAEDIDQALDVFAGLEVFCEISHREDPAKLLAAIAERAGRGARGKIRTGGVTAEAIPSVAEAARFVATAARLGAPFKATAGLHHPLRGEYPLTYEPDAALGTMHGFLNLFVAAALAAAGRLDQAQVEELLEERQAAAFDVASDSIAWRGHRLSAAELEQARGGLALSYGSCSFREPVEELRGLGLLSATATA